MNIFLTGATGGIGSRLIGLLQRNGHVVSALTRQSKHSYSINVRMVQGDLLSPSTYVHELKEADAIVHMAAVTHTNNSKLYERVNAEGTRLLLKAALDAGFTGRFLFVSTCAVGEECGSYGASKARAEEHVRMSPLAWTIIRPSEVYGASGVEAISTLISMARKSHVIPIPGRGHDRLAPVHIDDVLDGILQILGRVQATGKTYVLAGPEEMTYAECVRRLLSLSNRSAIMLPIPYVLLRAIARGYAWLGWSNPPLVVDQIARLGCSKSIHIAEAVQDLGYRPRRIEVGARDPKADVTKNQS